MFKQESPFTIDEAKAFVQKAEELVKIEVVEKSILFVVSIGGFRNNALDYMRDKGIAWSADGRWLESLNINS